MLENLKWTKKQNREAVSKWGEEVRADFPEVEIGDIARLGKILPNPDQIPNPIPDDGYFAIEYPINHCIPCRLMSPEIAQNWQIKAS